MSDLVPPSGPQSADVLLFGKAPGREECSANRPFVGKAGREHRAYCERFNLHPHQFRTTNLCRTFIEPNEPLTREQIDYWTPDLLAEISRTKPRLLVPVGAAPVKLLLGPAADLNTVHGIPHKPGAFGATQASQALLSLLPNVCILPLIQPAAGFHNPDSRALINWDYSQLARVCNLIRTSSAIDYRHDPYAGREVYRDVTGNELRRELLFFSEHIPPLIGLDTEGEFSLQVCIEPGVAFLLRSDQPDFHVGIEALQYCADHGSIFTGHNIGMYDLEVLRGFKLDLFHAAIRDTLFRAFLFCIEPLGLKPNSWRTLGMRMKSHKETVGALGKQFQIDYLAQVVEHTGNWPKPDPQFEIDNAGVCKVKRPNSIASRAQAILLDIDKEQQQYDEHGDLTSDEDEEPDDSTETGTRKKGAPTDPFLRWSMVKRDLRELARRVESEIGPMPAGTMRRLWEKDPEAAIEYSCKDSDASLRLDQPFSARLEAEGKTALAEVYEINVRVFSEMQENGMPASRHALEQLRERMTGEMLKLSAQIAHTYNDGLPFNPASNPQCVAVLERLGLRGLKRTKKGGMSASKPSIQHLKFVPQDATPDERYRREFAVLLFRWREHQLAQKFCTSTLDTLPDSDLDECTVRAQLLPWGIPTRRMRSKNPNLLAQPKHSVQGQMIRDCYAAPEGYVFLECDLASGEVCVMAHESGDPDLIRIMTEGVKIHRETAMGLFDIPREEVDDVQYLVGKRTIFGTFFGQTGTGLKEQLWMQNLTQFDDDACQDFIDKLKYKVYPGIGRYEQRVAAELRGTATHPNLDGSIRDLSGMERKLPGIHSDDRGVANEAIRHGVSQKIQGGQQALIQNAIAWLKDRVRELQSWVDVKWRLTIHDSLLLTCPEWAVEIVKTLIEEGLTQHCGYKLRVPIRAETKVAKTWGGIK